MKKFKKKKAMKNFVSAFTILGLIFISVSIVFADLNDGLVAYWPFNGNANDESENGNNGTVHGATLTIDRFGNPNSAYSFDGIGDYIDIGNNVKLPFPITVSAWVNLNNQGHNGLIFRNDSLNSSTYYHGISVRAGENIQGFVGSGRAAPSKRKHKTANSVLSLGNWHHIAVVFYAHNNIKLFADGEEVDGSYGGRGTKMTYSNTNGAIGMRNDSLEPVDGKIDDIRLYNRALSKTEIKILASPPTIMSILPNFGSVQGDTSVIVKGYVFQEDTTVSIGGSELVDVTVLPEVAASVTSQTFDITDDAADNVTLNINLKSTIEANGTITFSTDSKIINDISVLILIETSIANNLELAGKVSVSVEGTNSAVNVTFTTVDKGPGVKLSIEQTDGSDVLFSIVASDEGCSEIIGKTPPGTVGLHDVVVTNPDGSLGTLARGFAYMPSAKKYPTFDVNDDGVVDIFDLVLVGTHFGEDYRNIQAIASMSEIGADSGKTANVEIDVQNKVGVQGNRLLKVDINIDDVDDLYGCQFNLNFDPKTLRVAGTQAGDILSLDGASTYWSVSEVDNRIGRISDMTYVRKATKDGVSGSGTLATVVFDVKNVSVSDTTRLNLSNIRLVDVNTRRFDAKASETLLNWEELLIPERTKLLQNYPNPFNPETWVPFQLSELANVVITIYDVSGQIVRKFELGEMSTGVYVSRDKALYWNGRNGRGERVSSGVYFYNLQAGDYSTTKRMLILK